MNKHGKKYQWVLTESDTSLAQVKHLGVFAWVGSATGYVKHLTRDSDRVWSSDGNGIMSKWESEEDVHGRTYNIFPVEFNPRVDAVGE
jgi:hypothetical protein